MALFPPATMLLGGFLVLVGVIAAVKIASALVTTTFRAAGAIVSPTSWWRGSAWIWRHGRALVQRSQNAIVPEHDNVIRLPPAIHTRCFRKPILEERYDATGAHVLVVGPPGSGKTQGVFMTTLLDGWTGGSAIINDQAIGKDAFVRDVPGTIPDHAGQFAPALAPSRPWPSLRKECGQSVEGNWPHQS